MVSFLIRILAFSSSRFLHWTTAMSCGNVLSMFFQFKASLDNLTQTHRLHSLGALKWSTMLFVVGFSFGYSCHFEILWINTRILKFKLRHERLLSELLRPYYYHFLLLKTTPELVCVTPNSHSCQFAILGHQLLLPYSFLLACPFVILDKPYHPQRCLCYSYHLRTRSRPLLFECTIFCCFFVRVAEIDYSIERTFFSLSNGPQRLRCIALLILRCLFHMPQLKMILFVTNGRNWTKLSTRLQFETPNFSRNITRQVAKLRSFFRTSRLM